MSVDLSIVIVNYNTREYLRGCLNSIYSNPLSPGTFETIVVDNASADGSAEMVRACFPQVKLLASGVNLGFAAGNNLGYRHSTGEFVFILNPDTVVLPRCLDILVTFLRSSPQVGAAGPWIRDAERRNSIERWENRTPRIRFPMTYRNLTRRLEHFLPRRLMLPEWLRTLFVLPYTGAKAPFEVEWVLNAASMIRRSHVDREYLMDETFWIGTEEIELCSEWMKRSGRLFFMVPEAEIIHYVGRSYRHKLDWAIRLHRLAEGALHYRRTQLFGTVWARIDSIVGLIDFSSLSLVLWLMNLRRRDDERSASARLYLALLRIELRLAILGTSESLKIDRDLRKWVENAQRR